MNESVDSSPFSDTASYGNTGYDYLTPFEQYLYNELKELVEEVAAGRQASTVLEFDIYNYIIQEFPELADWVTEKEPDVTAESLHELLDKARDYTYTAAKLAFKALKLDCPYDLYWMANDRSIWSYFTYDLDYHVDDDSNIWSHKLLTATLEIRLYVASDYAVKKRDGSYEAYLVDTSKTQLASQTVTRAQAVVDQYASLPDYEKLIAYKDWICDHVSYDYDAYDAAWKTFQSAWQVINVFDDDPETNVVCDGYAKAFQYLCDLSTFQDPTTKCNMVVGWVNNGYHAWNIVTLTNTKGTANYIADVTWTDSSDGDWPVFLNGAKSGSIDKGYTFESSYGSTATYAYTNKTMAGSRDTVDFYGTDASSILNLSFEDYIDRPKPSEPVEPSKPNNNQNSGNKPSKPSNNNKPTTKTGWVQNGNTWYYYNSNGTMLKGWQLIGGVWYYLGSNGAMATGWTNVGGTWYYLNPSGAMATGWTQVGNTWYYLKSSGAMATGWQQIGGAWYYLNGSGAMQTGWYKVGPKWYYSNASGAMQANRWIGNYYVGSSGAMATSQWVGNYYVDASGLWVK